MAAAARSKWLVIGGACLVAISLAIAVMVSRQREAKQRNEVRKQTAFLMLDLAAEMDAASAAMHDFNADGGLDLSGLQAPAALDRRIRLAVKAQERANGVVSRGDALPDQLGQALRGMPGDVVAEAKRQLPEKANWRDGRHIFQTHVRAYTAARAHLEFMKKHHGHWRVDAVGMRVNWDNQQLQAEAEKLQAEVTAAAAAQGRPATRPAATQGR